MEYNSWTIRVTFIKIFNWPCRIWWGAANKNVTIIICVWLPFHKCLLRKARHNVMLIVRIVLKSGLPGGCRKPGVTKPTSDWSMWFVSLGYTGGSHDLWQKIGPLPKLVWPDKFWLLNWSPLANIGPLAKYDDIFWPTLYWCIHWLYSYQ